MHKTNFIVFSLSDETKINDITKIVTKKLDFFKNIIQKTIIHIQNNKRLDILSSNDVHICIESLEIINTKIQEISLNSYSNNNLIINSLQLINNDLSSLLKTYGTDSLEDLLLICFGNNNSFSATEQIKMEVLQKYFHPISYKVVTNNEKIKMKKKISDNENNEQINLSCYDISSEFKQFYIKVFGIKLYIYNANLGKSLIVYGIVDDISLDFLNNKYVEDIKKNLTKNLPKDDIYKEELFYKFMKSLNLTHFLTYENNSSIYGKYIDYINRVSNKNKMPLLQFVNEFISSSLYNKRKILVYLLIDIDNYENLYLAYLLYDLIYNDINVNNSEQSILFDTLPLQLKPILKHAIKKTINYTNDLTNIDSSKTPYEQQICLMKVSDSVKEKAIVKLKEIKSKTDESSSKARQYLENLLKIPFGIYKREPVLNIMNYIKSCFKNIYIKNNISKKIPDIPSKESYTSIEILKYIKKIELLDSYYSRDEKLNKIQQYLCEGSKSQIISNIARINEFILKFKIMSKIKHKSLNKKQLKSEIEMFVNFIKNKKDNVLIDYVTEHFIYICDTITYNIKNELYILNNYLSQITNYIKELKPILDSSVYGHKNAKIQVERIIAQFINGSDSSHILGFEGPPGVGKTTLAKGLSKCFRDENGNSRPFHLIALGGDSNASTLIGHNYTYVGSSYGKIVQILIDSKCMNPIILFDEIDKVSRNENGKELIGVLTHLLDSTQNGLFEDKYFSGIQLDLSKALFILSYNDVSAIDKVLLDRIHRIKFESLSIEEKIVICNDHLLPEIYFLFGLRDMIYFSDDVLKFIIEEYTLEPGVRKLKEKLFEIIGEINLNILKDSFSLENVSIPISISIEDIKTKYFKEMREIKIQKIHKESEVGVINCLWANSLGLGGILSATAKMFHSDKYLSLKLTGLLDKMMEESFQISLTNAYNLIADDIKKDLLTQYNGENKYGIHMHMGDGSIEKSGTSAGIAITILMYSLMTNTKIKNDFAVTGEAADLNGKVGEIGALKTKILYGIKAGVKNFIYPCDNKSDYDDFFNKYKDTEIIKGINFYPINNVSEALELILEK